MTKLLVCAVLGLGLTGCFGFDGGGGGGDDDDVILPVPTAPPRVDAGVKPDASPGGGGGGGGGGGSVSSMCASQLVSEGNLRAECSDLEVTRGPREVALSAQQLACQLVGRWRLCNHLGGFERPYGARNIAGIQLAADGRFNHLISDGFGGAVFDTTPAGSGEYKPNMEPDSSGAFLRWTLNYDDGEIVELYGVFSKDGSEMVSDRWNAGSVETRFVRTGR